MSTFSQQALRVGRSLLSWSNRLVKFAKHRVLTKRKSALIIGTEKSLLYTNLHPLLAKGWSIIHIQTAFKPQILQTKIQQPSSISDKDTEIVKEQANNSKPAFFKRLYLSDNYTEIQKSLQGKQFDSIIVLPQKPVSLSISDSSILSDYPQYHFNALMRQAFSYRLASKYLTTSGVVILSMSQSDFIQDSINNPTKQLEGDINPITVQPRLISDFIIDSQINYLGVVIGDRDYTDLNSWSIVALSSQSSQRQEEGKFVAKMYSKWADSQQLPMPGSFAMFKKGEHKNKTHFVQYL